MGPFPPIRFPVRSFPVVFRSVLSKEGSAAPNEGCVYCHPSDVSWPHALCKADDSDRNRCFCDAEVQVAHANKQLEIEGKTIDMTTSQDLL